MGSGFPLFLVKIAIFEKFLPQNYRGAGGGERLWGGGGRDEGGGSGVRTMILECHSIVYQKIKP